MKQVIKATPLPCKICQAPSHLFGVVDFNKSCLEQRGERLPLTGFAVYYHRCSQCGFIFTASFDEWTPDAFRQLIYNDQYIVVDPDFVEARPTGNAHYVAEVLEEFRSSVRLLDYGGGTGLFAQRMREKGFSATTYDPFSEFTAVPNETFNFITCFEVMEHVPVPDTIVATMASMLEQKGMILFSTLLQPAEIEADPVALVVCRSQERPRLALLRCVAGRALPQAWPAGGVLPSGSAHRVSRTPGVCRAVQVYAARLAASLD